MRFRPTSPGSSRCLKQANQYAPTAIRKRDYCLGGHFIVSADLDPIRHRTEDRVRAHVFLRMPSYYITCHMQARLAPVLFTDDDNAAASAARPSPVAPAARSPRALAKAATKHTPRDLPVHSFATLLADLGTICLNTIAPAEPSRCSASGSSPPPPRSSGRPSTCSASATASGSRSQQLGPAHHESPVKRPNARITEGNFGLNHRDPCPSRAGAQTACQATSAARAPGCRLAAMMTAIKHIWQHKMRNSGQSHRLTGSLPWHLSGHGKG